jgi:type II secretory pathway component PulL
MKRNIVRDLTAPKGTQKSWAKRWDIVPRVICLFLALLIWLAVKDASAYAKAEAEGEQTAEVETVE